MTKTLFIIAFVPLLSFEVLALGNSLDYGNREPTGTTDSQGQPNRKGGTITSTTGNTATANTPVGTDPTFSPANRNAYNDRNYRPGAPGTNGAVSTGALGDPRLAGNAGTLGTAAPAENPSPQRGGVAPGVGSVTGQAGSPGVQGSPSGNPGPEGPAGAPNTAPTGGSVGTGGSGSGGMPGSISNSGTHGINGSGH